LKIASGTSSVTEVLYKLENLISEQIRNIQNRSLSDKAKDNFYEIILSKTFVFYVPANSIKMSMVETSIHEMKNIIYTDNISEIIALTNLSEDKKNKYKINWIAVEFNKANINNKEIADNDLTHFLPFLSRACELDLLKKDTQNKKINFRIDFERLDKSFEKLGKVSDFFRNAKKHFYQSLFSFQTSEQKNNEINYVKQELIQKEYTSISVSKEDIKAVYLYRCQICGNQHEVILSRSKRGRKQNSLRKYVRVSNDFIYEKNNRYYVVCKHSGTKYEGINKFFSIGKERIDLRENNENINIDKIFLFQFFNFVLEDTTKIGYYKDGKQLSIAVDEFINRVS